MAFVDSKRLMGFCLGVDHAEDAHLAALLHAKIGQKGPIDSFELPQEFLDAGGLVDFV